MISLGQIIYGMYRNGIMTIFPFIQNEYDLTKTDMGFYFTILIFSSLIITIFAGQFVDKRGVRRSTLAGFGWMGIFIILHSLATGYIFIIIFAGLTGLGLSIILPAASKGVSEWFVPENQATIMGIVVFSTSLGGVLGSVILPLSASIFDWRLTTSGLGILFLLISFLFYLFYPVSKSKLINEEVQIFSAKKIFELFNDKYFLNLCSLGIILGIISGIISIHFTLYLFWDLGFSEIMAGFILMFLHIGSLIGRLGWGLLNDKYFKNNITTLSLLCLFIVNLSIVFAFLNRFSFSLFTVLILSFLIGATGRGWQGLYFSAVAKQMGDHKTGRGIATSLIFTGFGNILSPPVFGFIADKTGTYNYSWFILALFIIIMLPINFYLFVKFE